MNIIYIAQVTGAVSIFLLFAIKLYILISPSAWYKSGRTAVLWTTVYVFFLFALRLLQLFGIGTLEELRIVSGFAAVIPAAGVLIHLLLFQQTPPPKDIQESLEEAKGLLLEAKQIRDDATQTFLQTKQVTKKK